MLVLVGFGIEKVWKVGSIFVFGDGGGLKIYTLFFYFCVFWVKLGSERVKSSFFDRCWCWKLDFLLRVGGKEKLGFVICC